MFLFATTLIVPSYEDFELLGDHKPNHSLSSCVELYITPPYIAMLCCLGIATQMQLYPLRCCGSKMIQICL